MTQNNSFINRNKLTDFEIKPMLTKGEMGQGSEKLRGAGKHTHTHTHTLYIYIYKIDD